MTVAVSISRPDARGEARAVLAVWVAGVIYAAVLMAPLIAQPVKLGLVFNEMLVNLLAGRVDIDPAVIGPEAFEHDGKSYAYFGLFCALIRLPLLLAGRIHQDVTGLSLLLAAATSLGFRLLAVRAAMQAAGPVDRGWRLLMLIAVAAHGESVQYLRASLYQEVVSWGDALAAIFVYLAVRRLAVGEGRAAPLYAGMAFTAGLALTCRVTFGFGLYLALCLMLAVEAARVLRAGQGPRPILRRVLPAVLILAVFAVAAGAVNWARWGDPFSFSPLQYQAVSHANFPDRLPRLERYGELNPARIPYALQYYFAPVWSFTDAGGRFLFQAHATRLFDLVELPPGSFFLSDPLICLLAAIGLGALLRRRPAGLDPVLAGAALAGLAAPAILMLMMISLTFRYRMEFYPVLDLAACVGAAALSAKAAPLSPRAHLGLKAATAAGMLVAALGFVAYLVVPLGAAGDLDTRHGWLGAAANRLAGREVYAGHLMPNGRRIPLPR